MTYGKFATATAAALLATAGAASAAHLSYYAAELTPLNMSGVSGNVYLTYNGPEDDGMRSLFVQVRASGLEPGEHAGHVHGFEGNVETGAVQDSVLPVPPVFNPNDMLNGSDGDGFTELNEGAPFYGGILQTFTGLTADADGTVSYDQTFAVDAGSQLDGDIFDYVNRETVLHGMTVPFGPELDSDGNAIAGSIDPSNEMTNFNAFLPIATGAFVETTVDALPGGPAPAPVPLPAGIFLMGAALGSLGVARKLKKRA
ncbi:VPLPA-CTERM sorting domain-containing protein [uncultured Jannaschia sp.]|uniref:VPLPA-CTERM sorting domain-containing protein n=1 Tax=uncultured Jannaschia sp. TaxID=293347 RepID=UPI00261916AB|nr:VPLPA-CTERM sorting domain-containing protein [uncultured Jannaschia sp.]